MKPMNIISAYNSCNLEIEKAELTKGFKMKRHESRTLGELIELLKKYGADSRCFGGFYYLAP